MKRILGLSTLVAVCIYAAVAYAGNLNTSGKCPSTGNCQLGLAGTTRFTIDADDGLFFLQNGESINNALNSTFDFTRNTAGLVVITASDDDDIAALQIAQGGAAALTLGDSSTTAISVIADGGTVTIDGYVQAQVNVVSQTAGAITINTVTLVTAAGDYTIADDLCAVTADIGNWFTLVFEDDSVVVVINPLDAADVLFIPGLDIAAGDEADSDSTAAFEGAHITMTCLAVNGWYATSLSYAADGTTWWVDGGSS